MQEQSEVPPRHEGDPGHQPERRRLPDPPDLQTDLQADEHGQAGQQDGSIPDDHEERRPQREGVSHHHGQERGDQGEPVSHRVQDLAQRGDLAGVARHVAVDPVGRHDGPEQQQPRCLRAVVKDEHHEQWDEKDPEEREQVGNRNDPVEPDGRDSSVIHPTHSGTSIRGRTLDLVRSSLYGRAGRI